MAGAQHAAEGGEVQHLPLEMGAHPPEAIDRGGGDAKAELGEIAFEEGADELLSPSEAGRVVPGQQAVGKSAAQPQRLFGGDAIWDDLAVRKGRELEERDAASEAL